MRFVRSFVLLFLLTLAHCQENQTPHDVPGPLITKYTEPDGRSGVDEEVRLKCTSWRFAVEANNLGPWKTIPEECVDYVKDYILGKGYKLDLERVSVEAGAFAASHGLVGDGMDIWVFDVDETLLSNIPYYSGHGFGLEVFDHKEFDKWVEKGMAPAIQATLELYEEVLKLGYKTFLLTGRSNSYRGITIENLIRAGFHDWEKLIMRKAEEQGKSATIFKSEKRDEMVKEGYRIGGNSGDQWSDLVGSNMATRSFKLPNPMYYIS